MTTIGPRWVEPSLQTRIAAQVHAWEKMTAVRQPLAAEQNPFVTISRQFGCQALQLAQQLVEILNARQQPARRWIAYDRELLEKVAQELHLRREVVDCIDDRRRSEMTQLFDFLLNHSVDDALLFRKLAEVIRALALRGHTVIVGRGSYLITAGLKTGLHVRLVAPLGWRVDKVSAEWSLQTGEAWKLVKQRQKERDRFLRGYFVTNPDLPFLHDVVLDNSQFTVEQMTEIVFTTLSVRYGEAFASTSSLVA